MAATAARACGQGAVQLCHVTQLEAVRSAQSARVPRTRGLYGRAGWYGHCCRPRSTSLSPGRASDAALAAAWPSRGGVTERAVATALSPWLGSPASFMLAPQSHGLSCRCPARSACAPAQQRQGHAMSCRLRMSPRACRPAIRLTRAAAALPSRRCLLGRQTRSSRSSRRARAQSLGASSGPQARGTCAASRSTQARSGSSSAARGLGAVNSRFGAGNRGAREAQRAKVLTPTGGADILPKTTAPEFKKPVLVDFFFEERQLLRFQVRSAAARAQRYGAEPLTGACTAHVRRCSASARGPGHDW